ncbi:hypothetical protein GCM10022200_15180 [Microbacterium awajiense]|uniref:VanZ-like domain-containing protein n=1 Tax=Microbacterium awajiense TaxID=415214 RepID=A0ABP7AIR9_9MICO
MPPRSDGGGRRTALVAYLCALALIALWPARVDQGADALIAAVTDAVPALTYDVVEIGANVLLFVPFGALGATLVRSRLLVVLLALAASVAMEVVQALALEERTASAHDVLANVTGACLGLVLAEAIADARTRSRRSADRRPVQRETR